MTIAGFRNILLVLVAIVSLAGLADAMVLGSKYSRIGRIPVAGLGALAYFSVFSFATFAGFGYLRARTFLLLTVGAMFLSTLWFLYVQAFLLHAYCRYCLFSAAVTFLLAGLVIALPPREA